MNIFPIQASSVPCKRVFSSSKETTTARRNKLSPNLIEALQILKFEAKYNKMLNFTVGLNQDEKMAELEAIKKTQPVEDLDGLF
jgi:hAT family protein